MPLSCAYFLRAVHAIIACQSNPKLPALHDRTMQAVCCSRTEVGVHVNIENDKAFLNTVVVYCGMRKDGVMHVVHLLFSACCGYALALFTHQPQFT